MQPASHAASKAASTTTERNAGPAAIATNAARLKAVSRRYGTVTAVDQIDLDIPSGQIVAILGPNGAGKTTLINLLLGLTQPDNGQIEVLGHLPGSMAARQRIGVMLQQAEMADTLRVGELVAQFANYYPQPLATADLLHISGLQELAQRPYGKLSGGEKRRVQFAIALAGNPALIFLDEPTTGLDVQARQQLWQQIHTWAARGRSIVLTTHYLEEADQLAHRILVMRQGRIIADGSPEAIKSRIQLRQVRCRSRLPALQLPALHPDLQPIADDDAVTAFTARPDGNGTHLHILTTQAEAVVYRLLQADPQLTSLEVSGADLEQAFLALTATGTASTGNAICNRAGASR